MISTALVGDTALLDPATTWASLGRLLWVDELVVVADALLWTPRARGGYVPAPGSRALASREELVEVLARGRWRGAPKLREAVEAARDGSQSPPETLLRLRLVEAGLPEPELNAEVHDELGRWIASPDLSFRELRVCVEYQGAHHRSDGQYTKDIDRLMLLRNAGWIVVELTAAHVLKNPEWAVARVRRALREARGRGGRG